jgi:2-keto-4-pentenoate hydratase/2-oxohepta-3-ene-1,7-dioic acid hydratase in catechol pathway
VTRLATVWNEYGRWTALVRGDRFVVLPDMDPELASLRTIAGGGPLRMQSAEGFADSESPDRWHALAGARLGPAVPDPGAIYTIGSNYRALDEPPGTRPDRPPVFGKAPTSVTGDGALLAWDRTLTANVMGECELGVVLGPDASVLGYTIVNDVTSQDPWLDGDQWLLGKSMPGFCPVGPWIVSADELDPSDLRLGFRVNGITVQDGRTSQMRFSIPEIVAYLSAHVALRPGDLIATGTPARTGPDAQRTLQPGDVMTAWIDGIGELSNPVG